MTITKKINYKSLLNYSIKKQFINLFQNATEMNFSLSKEKKKAGMVVDEDSCTRRSSHMPCCKKQRFQI